ncbi:hypothetical protein Tco_1447023 [Tanacetum coccineum]
MAHSYQLSLNHNLSFDQLDCSGEFYTLPYWFIHIRVIPHFPGPLLFSLHDKGHLLRSIYELLRFFLYIWASATCILSIQDWSPGTLRSIFETSDLAVGIPRIISRLGLNDS